MTVSQVQPDDLASLNEAFQLLEQGYHVHLRGKDKTSAEKPPEDSQPMLGFYSSGSTGSPKLVWRSWEQIKREVRLDSRSSSLIWASPYSPLSFAGVQVAAQAWRSNSTVLALGAEWNKDFMLLVQRRVTALSCTPTFLDMLLQFREDATLPLSQITLGGEVLRAAAGERFRQAFPRARFSLIYASAEHGVLLKTHRTDGWYEVETLEKRYPAWRVREGELQLYADGEWRGTGDMVEMENRLIRVIGRVDRVANIGGSKVSLDEVTRAAEEVPGVRRALAFAEPNPVCGQIVCLRFTPEAGSRAEEVRERLQNHLRNTLRKEAWPRRWEVGAVGLGANSKRSRA